MPRRYSTPSCPWTQKRPAGDSGGPTVETQPLPVKRSLPATPESGRNLLLFRFRFDNDLHVSVESVEELKHQLTRLQQEKQYDEEKIEEGRRHIERITQDLVTVRQEDDKLLVDRDQLNALLSVRSRRPGDGFHPFGAPGSKTLKAFLIDAKLPRWERERLALVAAGGKIVWLVGLRRAAAAPVTPATCRLIELSAERHSSWRRSVDGVR